MKATPEARLQKLTLDQMRDLALKYLAFLDRQALKQRKKYHRRKTCDTKTGKSTT